MIKTIYTHDEAADIVELFEDILYEHGIIVPSPEDDERDPDNAASLYGTTYYDLVDEVEDRICEMLDARDNGAGVVKYVFQGGKADVQFVSYNGCYPNLCYGELVLRINGERRVLHEGCMQSGGYVTWEDEERAEKGKWSVTVPNDLMWCKAEIEACVNEHVPYGCCGGCI